MCLPFLFSLKEFNNKAMNGKLGSNNYLYNCRADIDVSSHTHTSTSTHQSTQHSGDGSFGDVGRRIDEHKVEEEPPSKQIFTKQDSISTADDSLHSSRCSTRYSSERMAGKLYKKYSFSNLSALHHLNAPWGGSISLAYLADGAHYKVPE